MVGLKRPIAPSLLGNLAILAQGKVVEEGNPMDLLAHGRHYATWVARRSGSRSETDGADPSPLS